MKTLISLIALLVATLFTSTAQVGPPVNSSTTLECGFIATQEQLNNLENNQNYQEQKHKFIAEFGQRALTQIDWVPIKAHIVRTSLGTGGLAVVDLTSALDNMNLYYINANMQFYICDGINYIDDDTYYDFDASDEAALHAAHGVANLINIYFCNSVGSGASAYCGYAYYPGGTDLIMMDNSCAMNGSTLPHEMGHFYSLRHTHGGSNGTLTTELVDGSNCGTDGDFVCDTEADPQLGNANVNPSCIYDGTAPYTSGGGLDGNGAQFVPNPNNIMSYARKSCRNLFTVGQYARINAAHMTTRNYFTCPTYNADFVATPTSSCTTPITVNFTDNSVGATSWQWDVDGDNVVDYTTQNPSHVYAVAGNYDVRLTISDGSTSLAKTKVSFISVGALGSVPYSEDYETFTSSTDATGLLNGWSTNPENTTSDYRWNVDENGTPSNGTGPTVDNTLGTSIGHYMHIEASSGAANDVAELISACIDLNVGAPELSFAYHMHGSSMGELHLDIYAGGTWTNDIMTALVGEQSANQNDPYSNQAVDLTAWAGQIVQLRFRAVRGASWAGDMAIDDIDIQCVSANPIADFSAASTIPCIGEVVLFSDASVNTASWLWNFGVGATPATATGAGPHSVVYSSGGDKTVSLIATGGCSTDAITKTNYLTVGSSSSGSMAVSMCDSYTSPSTNYTWTSTGTYLDTIPNAIGCDSSLTINLTITNSNASTDTQSACDSYTWPLNGTTYTNSTSTPAVTLTNTAGCDSIVSLNLTINNSTAGTDTQVACDSYTWPLNGTTYTISNTSPTVTLTSAAGCDSVVTLNLTINSVSDNTTTLTSNTIQANNASASYVWLNCDNNYSIISGETNQIYVPSANGNYAVELMENGCVDTSACVAITTVGIIENDFGEELFVFPNPTDGNFTIDLGDSYSTVEISISDINGKLIRLEKFGQKQVVSLFIKEASGVYLLTVSAGDKIAIIRLVKN
ncbi:MAG: PKD repeat protein [Gammaproteobacteria bacterium]|jgi:PKD repeat protein